MKSYWKKKGKFNVTPNGYKVNRHLGWGFLVLFLLYTFVVSNYYFNNPNLYLACNSKAYCENPYYERCDDLKGFIGEEYPALCAKEYLLPGEEWGKEPPFYAGNVAAITIAMLLVLFGLNHFLYNGGFGNDIKKSKL